MIEQTVQRMLNKKMTDAEDYTLCNYIYENSNRKTNLWD